jgi:hypothetical protein
MLKLTNVSELHTASIRALYTALKCRSTSTWLHSATSQKSQNFNALWIQRYIAEVSKFQCFMNTPPLEPEISHHKAFLTSILLFKNFNSPTIYTFRTFTEGTFLTKNGVRLENFHDLHIYSAYRGTSLEMKWLLLRDCLYLHVLSRTTITFCWSAIQLRQIGILLYRMKVVFDNHSKYKTINNALC